MDFKSIIAEMVHEEIGMPKHEIESVIEVPPDPKLGDYALPCFSFAKQLKKGPANIALELKDKLTTINLKEDHKHFELITNAGPYLNFFVNKEAYIKNILHNIHKEDAQYGSGGKTGKLILIESPGPNTNKPLHLGHLRNMLLGQSLARMLTFIGNDVKIVNVVNDRGVHICKSMLAYEKLGNHTTPQSTGRKPDHFVGDYYVRYQKLEEQDPEVEKEVQQMLIRWEEGDEKTRKLWNTMNAWVFEGFKETYEKLGFHIDKEYYESETYLHGREIITEGLKKGVFEKDDTGAIIANLEAKGLGKKVLLRANGTSVYITQDIYMAKLRHDEFDFDGMYYVVANEQDYHFKVLFEVFRMLGWKFADKCHHFSYGMVELPEGKMKSREGNVVDTDDLIDEVTKIAQEEIKKRYENLGEAEIKNRSRIIALSAIRFFFIKHDPVKNFVYNPKESLAFDGETGPYIEYSYARINSIFRKFKEKEGIDAIGYIKDSDLSQLKEKNEFEIAKMLAAYPHEVEEAAKNMKPSSVAHYLLTLAQKFNEMYHVNPVLSSPEELKKARLYLIYCVQLVIKSAMKLLSIEEIDEM